jgi:hypothetical protein
MSLSPPPRLPLFDHDQVLPLGFRFPTRMSVLPLGAGKLALVSPVPIDDARAAAIAELGSVAFLIAPNLLHHLYLEAAATRYPDARVLAPSGLRAKRPGLPSYSALDHVVPPELAAAVEVVPVEGAPGLDEFGFFHRATRTLVLTDLVFNIRRPQGLLAHLLLALGGAHGRLASSRALRVLVKDRAAARASVERLLALPFETLVLAHGDIVEHDARSQLEQALAWLLPSRKPLPLVASGRGR